jgi:hypothetical protein
MARILWHIAPTCQLGLVSPTAHGGVQSPAFGDECGQEISAFVAHRGPPWI